MELIEGEDLAARLERSGPLPSAEVIGIAQRLAAALAAAHEAGVLHRDLKPSNILVARKGGLYITDFGIATSDGSKHKTLHDRETGIRDSTYMAPEATERGGVVTERSDLYSLGLILYERLPGAALRPPRSRHSARDAALFRSRAALEIRSRYRPRARGPDPRIDRQGSGEAAAFRGLDPGRARRDVVGADRGSRTDASDRATADRGAGLQCQSAAVVDGRPRLARAGAHLPGARHGVVPTQGRSGASTFRGWSRRALRRADRHRTGQRERGAGGPRDRGRPPAAAAGGPGSGAK